MTELLELLDGEPTIRSLPSHLADDATTEVDHKVSDFSFTADELAAFGLDQAADDMLSHIYPGNKVEGWCSRA